MSEIRLPPHLSFSSLGTYNTCGERFRLEKVERVSSIPGWALVGGSAVHEVTEQLDREMFGQGPEYVETFAAAFERLTEEQTERSGFTPDQWHTSGRASKAWPNKEDRAWWLHHGPVFVESWQRWRETTAWNIWLTPSGEPAIEVELMPIFGDVPVKMFIDRLFVTPDGELVVLDLKSGSRTPKPAQLGLYAAGVEQVFGLRPSFGTYWMARSGGTGIVHQLDAYTDTRLGYEFSTARKGMELGLFPAKPSELCSACGVKRACYATDGELASEFAPFKIGA